MQFNTYLKLIMTALVLLWSIVTANAQAEILTNETIIKMSGAGVAKEIVIEKISTSIGNFNLAADELINLKKAGVDDAVVAAMFEMSRKTGKQNISPSIEPQSNPPPKKDADKTAAGLLREARTITFTKNSLYPSLKEVESSLLTRGRRKRWDEFNLTIVEDGTADLLVEIGHEFLSHYNFRVTDAKTGRLIAASGVTSFGGSLAGNVADKLIKRLNEVLANEVKQK